ncbi:ras guanine nucleotide exchange factor domain-containing protein [Cercophora scortea]|uniref:Ras guanine nucleotide exchange factor domain-containing protein n=1 Tax=Cercophora scortea TaxID=314031 RepID=A0AAE0I8E4_9PEZI|nr:ras guanine nucleotide exchange factor domain-containing protein [Cercophora scortea]
MAMLSSQPARSSLYVAPLTLQKSKTESYDNASDMSVASSDRYSQCEITPPTTPNGSQEDLGAQVDPAPVFHNFLRAFYPFDPGYAMSDATVTLPLNEGDVVLVHSIHTNGWADGTLLVSGARGWLPTNYCEAYDPEEMRNLLKALLNFWDLMRSTSINDREIFGSQEFMKGIIGGVRFLLERTHCLTRESAVVQRHDALRRSRKSLLSELSSLVKTAKRLQEAQKMVDPEEEINNIVDEMILKAFRIVTKGVRFLDTLQDDSRSQIPTVAVITAVMEEAYVPPTPPAESTAFDADHGAATDASSRVGENVNVAEPALSEPNQATQSLLATGKRLSSAYLSGTNTHRLSQATPLLVNRLSSTVSHRVSLAGPSPSSGLQNLISERVNSCHDIFLSHLGSFIGRLQLQSQSRPLLALAVKQSVTSGGQLLVVIDIVSARNPVSVEALNLSRAAMYDRIQNLMQTARDILSHNEPEMEGVIVPQDNDRLLGAATGCVKATGDCVAKTRWVIERIGDFEFEFDNGSIGFDIDLSALDLIAEGREGSNTFETASIAGSNASEAPTTTTTISAVSSAASRSKNLSIDKPLPEVPAITSPIEEMPEPHHSPPTSRPQSIVDDGASSMVSSVASLRHALPPLPRISTSIHPVDDYSPIEPSVSQESEFHSFRSDSMTTSSTGSGSGSASTYVSRDSELSIVSQTSTRATTPDITAGPKNQPSLSDISVAGSSTQTEVDDVESKLLEKTYAHELMFNNEGQIIGGSLAALIERLTSHESTPDAMFVSTFYLTFRLFCTPLKLAEALVDRFDYVGETPHVAAPVRLRTYNVFKGWLESHWRHDVDREALALIKNFAEFKLNPILPSAGKRLIELTDKFSSVNKSLVPRFGSIGKTPSPITPFKPTDTTPYPSPIITKSQINALASWKAGGSSPSILDFDELEIARQLTVKQMTLFCAIMPDELLGSKWTKGKGADSPNVKAMSSFTTSLSNLVADTILQFSEVKKRATVIKHWIKIANQCLGLQNYDALMAITCALTDTSIKRLKLTWDTVSFKRREMLRTLQSIIDFNGNYKVLRARLHTHVPSCLPFLGMFLTDLTFVDVGNPAIRTSDTGLTVINFDKHTRTAKSIGELQRFQIPYRLTELPDLQEWLAAQVERVREKDNAGTNAQVSHYRKSLLLEPRETQHLQTPNDANGVFSWMRGNSSGHGLPAQI